MFAPEIVAEANPPRPFVSSHSRLRASAGFAQMPRSKLMRAIGSRFGLPRIPKMFHAAVELAWLFLIDPLGEWNRPGAKLFLISGDEIESEIDFLVLPEERGLSGNSVPQHCQVVIVAEPILQILQAFFV